MGLVDKLKFQLTERGGFALETARAHLSDPVQRLVHTTHEFFKPFSAHGRAEQRLETLTDKVEGYIGRYSDLTDQELLKTSQRLRQTMHEAYYGVPDNGKKERREQDILEHLIPRAYSLMHEAIVRAELPSNKGENSTITNLTRQQLKGGVAMVNNIIDMKTGEGKTLTALLPAYLHGLLGEGVHVNTVNEYLAERDYQQAKGIFERLGISSGITLSDEGFLEYRKDLTEVWLPEIQSTVAREMEQYDIQGKVIKFVETHLIEDMRNFVRNYVDQNHGDEPSIRKEEIAQGVFQQVLNNQIGERLQDHFESQVQRQLKQRAHVENQKHKKEAYAADITYGEQSEFAFDYLRDHTKNSVHELINPDNRRGFAIIDEIDNILIDEGLTPHIMSASTPKLFDDTYLRNVKARLEEFQKEQQYLVEYSEDNLKDFIEQRKVAQQSVLKRYAAENGLSREQLQAQLHGGYPLVDLRMELDAQYRAEIGKELFLLYHMTSDNESLSRYFQEYRHCFLDVANREKEDREKLLEDLDYIVSGRENSVVITEKGMEKLFQNGFEPELWTWMNTFLEASEFKIEGRDYQVQDGKIVTINERTGRPEPSKRYSGGLHEALECLHDVEIRDPTKATGKIPLEKFFQLYKKMTGMSGSVMEVAGELKEAYEVSTVPIEPSTPIIRDDQPVRFYLTDSAKNKALLEDILALHAQGRPVLLGVKDTRQAAFYEALLKEAGAEEYLQVLTASSAAEDGFDEAKLISQAGREGKITIATNMAGRGTDIKLSEEAYQAGGLHVILSYLPSSIRDVVQFNGRAGRLGDPGSSRMYTSFEDQLFIGTSIQRWGRTMGEGEDDADADICDQNWLLRKIYETAVDRVLGDLEQNKGQQRANSYKLNEPEHVVREGFYGVRSRMVRDKDALTALRESVEYDLERAGAGEMAYSNGDRQAYVRQCHRALENVDSLLEREDVETINRTLSSLAVEYLDREWPIMLENMRKQRKGIGLVGHGQRDPKIEYPKVVQKMDTDFHNGVVAYLTQEVARIADSYTTKQPRDVLELN